MQGTAEVFSALAISGIDVQSRPSWKRAASVNHPEEKLDLDPWERTPGAFADGPRVGQGGFESRRGDGGWGHGLFWGI